MAMVQWCGAIARRIVMTELRRPPFMASSSSSSSMSFSATSGGPAGEIRVPILCGRGDKKTKKGKRFKGSYGNSRPKKEKKIERIKDKVEVPRSTPWPLPFKLI
ncbi:small ribosomal subunit protein bTHXm [Cannabis sativa]|uniref:small ribosomal subunit protein bTHXm n=1 Tax=Cannabis sativa TaxID=3483 RepID=UPI0029CA348B|nr:small ribosomal subunit protein bTHXm [Cannabis sativa]